MRIETMVRTNDGFKIAEADLQLRGPGEVEGTQQSGIGAQFRIARIEQDGQLIEQANAIAQALIVADPALALDENARIKAELQRRARGLRYSQVG